jgi:hypothetical protein
MNFFETRFELHLLRLVKWVRHFFWWGVHMRPCAAAIHAMMPGRRVRVASQEARRVNNLCFRNSESAGTNRCIAGHFVAGAITTEDGVLGIWAAPACILRQTKDRSIPTF